MIGGMDNGTEGGTGMESYRLAEHVNGEHVFDSLCLLCLEEQSTVGRVTGQRTEGGTGMGHLDASRGVDPGCNGRPDDGCAPEYHEPEQEGTYTPADPLREHLTAEHDTPAELAAAVSDTGAQVLHEGAHTVRRGRAFEPDGAGGEHVRTGRTEAAKCPRCGRESRFSGEVAWCPCSGWLGSRPTDADPTDDDDPGLLGWGDYR